MNFKHLVIAKNATILLLADIVSKVLQTLLSIIIARKLGSSELGLLRYAISFTVIFSFIPNFGFKTFINREVSKYPEKSGIYFSNLALVKLILSFFTFLIIFVSSAIMHAGYDQLMLVSMAALVMLLDSFIQFYTAFFRGFQKAEYEGLLRISLNFLIALTGIVIVSMGHGIILLMIVRLAVTFIIFVVGFLMIKIKIVSPPFTLRASSCASLIKSALPFTILTLLVVVNANIGIVLLTNMKSTTDTGWYTAALNLCGIFQFIPASIAGAILPAMTRFAREKDLQSLSSTLRKAIKCILIIVLPIAAGTTFLSDKIIIYIYGLEYSSAIFTLRILIWMIVLSFPNTIFNAALSSIDEEKKFVRVQAFGTALNILLCALLIPHLGHDGLAISVISSQFVVFVFALFYLSKYFTKINLSSIGCKPILATLFMLLGLIVAKDLHVLISVTTGFIIYVMFLLILKVFDTTEINFIKAGFLKFYQNLQKPKD